MGFFLSFLHILPSADGSNLTKAVPLGKTNAHQNVSRLNVANKKQNTLVDYRSKTLNGI